MSEYISDIQVTDGLDMPTLVREINNRWRILNRNERANRIEIAELQQDVFFLTILTTVRTYIVSYRNNVDIEIASAGALNVYIEELRVHGPDGNMNVDFGIDRASNPGVFDTIILDPPLSPIPVTVDYQTYSTLAADSGGNANLDVGDVLEVQTSAGTVGNELFVTVKFFVEGLSDDPVQRAHQITATMIERNS